MFSISGMSPSPGQKLVEVNSSVEFTLLANNSEIDLSTLIVEFAGYYAIFNGEIKDPFLINSTISSSGDNYEISLVPEFDLELGKVYEVSIHVASTSNEHYHEKYSFKTIPNEPILVESSPKNSKIVTTQQMIYLKFEDSVDGIDSSSLNIWINDLLYIEDGNFISAVNGPFSQIENSTNTLSIRIDLIEGLRNREYIVKYQVSDTNGFELFDFIKFTVNLPELPLPVIFPQINFLGYDQGIKKVENIGTGSGVKITWNTPLKRIYKNDAFIIIYQNKERLNVFDTPAYLAFPSATELELNNLEAGQPYSFAARALETPSGIINPSGMLEMDENVYKIPSATEIIVSFSDTDLELFVESTIGYPESGLLLVGREVIKYESIDRDLNSFQIPLNGRGLVNTTPENYFIGDSVQMFLRCTDDNTIIVSSTPNHQDGYGFDRELNYEGLVVTDYRPNDEHFFQGYDFCGWHDPQPNKFLLGTDNCGSYMGGEYNGFRGLNIYDRLLDNAEVQLNTIGEPIILLKRIWDGKVCDCVDNRKMSARVKNCNKCYGTQFDGGYTQYHNLRRTDRRLLMSFDGAAEDLMYGASEGLQQDHKPNAWTLPMPAIRDRDLILRFDILERRTFIYEVLNASREPLYGRLLGMQTLSLQRLDKTDIVYTIPIDLATIPEPSGS